jgi:hypothetical protein
MNLKLPFYAEHITKVSLVKILSRTFTIPYIRGFGLIDCGII